MVAPLWLPGGVALAMVLWHGKNVFWGVTFAASIVTMAQGIYISWSSVVACILVGIGAGLQSIWAARFIEYYTHTRTPFYTVKNIIIFIFGGDLLLSLTSCTIGINSLMLFGLINPEDMFKNWFIWWLSDSIGILVITPLIMTWYQNKHAFNWKLFLEFGSMIILLGCTSVILYMLGHPRLAFTLLPSVCYRLYVLIHASR